MATVRAAVAFTTMKDKRYIEKVIAVASFLVAATLAFTSLIISEDHEVASSVLLAIAQFLTLTATLLGIDYKFSSITKDGLINRK